MITSGTTSKKKRRKIPDNDCEVIVHDIRRGSLKPLSDYESDDCSDAEMNQSPGISSCYKRKIMCYSSDDSTVIVQRKRLNKNPVAVTSENSDIDESSNSQQLALKALSDYETGESNGKSFSSSSSNQKYKLNQSLSAKDHVESDDSHSEVEVIGLPLKRRFHRKRPLVIETETSDSDSQKPIAHTSKKQKTQKYSNKNNLGEPGIFNENDTNYFTKTPLEYNLPSTSGTTRFTENQQFAPNSIKNRNKKTAIKNIYSSSEREDSDSSNLIKHMGSLFNQHEQTRAESSNDSLPANMNLLRELGSNDPCSSNTNHVERLGPETNKSVRQRKKQRIVSSDESDDYQATNFKLENSERKLNKNPSSSEDSFEDFPDEFFNRRVTRSSFSKERKQYVFSSSSNSSDSSDDTRFLRLVNIRQPSTDFVANQVQSSSRNCSRDDSSDDSPDRRLPVITRLNNLGNPSTVSFSSRLTSQESLPPFNNNLEQRSSRLRRRQRRERDVGSRILNNTLRQYVPVDSDDSSSDSDIQPRISRYHQRKRVTFTSDLTSSSDSDSATARAGSSDLNRPYRVHWSSALESVQEEESDVYCSESDIQPKTSRHSQRRVITSDHTSSSDSDEVIVTRTRRGGTRLKIEDSDDNKEEQNPGNKNTNNSSDSDNDSEKCPICFDKFRLQEVGSPESCDHSFCAVCIQEWAKNNNTCPVDRKLFNSITVRSHLQGRIDRQVPIETPARNPFEEFNGFTLLSDQVLGMVGFLQMINFGDSDEENVTFYSDSEGPDEICCVCDGDGEDGDIIACDRCDNVYHLGCVNPPLHHIPVGDWLCTQCR